MSAAKTGINISVINIGERKRMKWRAAIGKMAQSELVSVAGRRRTVGGNHQKSVCRSAKESVAIGGINQPGVSMKWQLNNLGISEKRKANGVISGSVKSMAKTESGASAALKMAYRYVNGINIESYHLAA
jgi:hypothetical protein